MINIPVSTDFNQLLQALPDSDFNKLRNYLEPVYLKKDAVIYQANEPVKYVYFPQNCLISMQTLFNDGISIESGIIGREGIVGACIALSNMTSSREAVVQIEGRAQRMKTEDFRSFLRTAPAFNRLVQKYIFAFIEQVAQIGACSNHHSLGQRVPRLLLMAHDRIEGTNINLTQESIAHMLAAHRPNITNVAIKLKDRGIITCQRGTIKIIERRELEKEACECYQVIKKSYNNYSVLLKRQTQSSREELIYLQDIKGQNNLSLVAVYN